MTSTWSAGLACLKVVTISSMANLRSAAAATVTFSACATVAISSEQASNKGRRRFMGGFLSLGSGTNEPAALRLSGSRHR